MYIIHYTICNGNGIGMLTLTFYIQEIFDIHRRNSQLDLVEIYKMFLRKQIVWKLDFSSPLLPHVVIEMSFLSFSLQHGGKSLSWLYDDSLF